MCELATQKKRASLSILVGAKPPWKELSIERRFLLAIREVKAHDVKSPAGALPTGAGG
jgi:hypothetical protein